METSSFEWYPVTKQEAKGTNCNTAGVSHQEALLHCEDDQALAQIAQRGCGVSILRDIKKLSGHSPGQPA